MEQTFEKFVAPVRELNELTLNNIEKIAAIQVKNIQENAKISVDALRSTAGIKDIDSLRSYLDSQVSVAQDLYQKAVEDAQEIARLSESYASDVKAIVKKSVPTA